jgi:cytochrome P450
MRTPARPPSASSLPVVGNLADLARGPLDFVRRLQQEHGDYVLFSLGSGKRALLVSDPSAIRQVLLETGKRYGKGMSTYALRKILGNGLVTSEGELWKRQRKLVAPAFQHHGLGKYADQMVTLTNEQTQRWQDGAIVDIHEEMMLLTQRIIMMSLFDVDVAGEAKEAGEAFDAMMRGLGAEVNGIDALLPAFVPTPSRMSLSRAVDFIDARLREMVAERQNGGSTKQDLLAALMDARDEAGQPMDEDQLLDEMRTLYLAGHETTANTLAFAWLLLSGAPAAYERLLEEIDGLLGGHPATFDDVQRLPWTNAVFKEALRLYPVAWVHQRQALEDVELGGYRVEKGTFLWMSPWVVHRDARWYPQPEEFRPERWLAPREEQPPADAFIAFGGGPRICLGNGFATVEGALLLATILQRRHVAVQGGSTVEIGMAGTIYPKHGLPAQVTVRQGVAGGLEAAHA